MGGRLIGFCFQGFALAVKGGGDSGFPLFQQTDVGKIPAKVKHETSKHDQRIADRPTAGIEVAPHYH